MDKCKNTQFSHFGSLDLNGLSGHGGFLKHYFTYSPVSLQKEDSNPVTSSSHVSPAKKNN